MAGRSGDTILGSRARVRILQRTDFFSEKKSSLPGGQSQYSLQRTVGGALGLAADPPARIVPSAFVEWRKYTASVESPCRALHI